MIHLETIFIRKFNHILTKKVFIHSIMNPSVVIIGAGISGLSAATHLSANGIKKIQILEATNRLLFWFMYYMHHHL